MAYPTCPCPIYRPSFSKHDLSNGGIIIESPTFFEEMEQFHSHCTDDEALVLRRFAKLFPLRLMTEIEKNAVITHTFIPLGSFVHSGIILSYNVDFQTDQCFMKCNGVWAWFKSNPTEEYLIALFKEFMAQIDACFKLDDEEE
jgi:hypothetical protein